MARLSPQLIAYENSMILRKNVIFFDLFLAISIHFCIFAAKNKYAQRIFVKKKLSKIRGSAAPLL